MGMRIERTSDLPHMGDGVLPNIRVFDQRVANVAAHIHDVAANYSPVQTGALRNSGHIVGNGTDLTVIFGSSRVPYAYTRHVWNRTGVIRYLLAAAEPWVLNMGVRMMLGER